MTAEGEAGKERSKVVDVTPGGRSLTDHEGGDGNPWPPAEVASDERSHADVHVETPEQGLGVDDRGLDLDDEQDPMHGMEGEEMHPTPVPVSVEAHFGTHGPVEAFQPARPECGHGGMIRVEEAIDLLTLPSEVPAELETDGGGDDAHRAQAQPHRLPALEQRAHGRTDAGRLGQVREPPASPMATRAHREPQATIIHRAR